MYTVRSLIALCWQVGTLHRTKLCGAVSACVARRDSTLLAVQQGWRHEHAGILFIPNPLNPKTPFTTRRYDHTTGRIMLTTERHGHRDASKTLKSSINAGTTTPPAASR